MTPYRYPLRQHLPAYLAIAVIALALIALFAWAAGWLSQRLTAQKLTNTIEAGGSLAPGFRRAHSKGICVTGVFRPSQDAKELSAARVFSQAETPVLGRLSIGGGDPYGADAKARVRSMALLFRTDDGQQWRTAMNSFTFFAVPSAQAFQEQAIVQRPDPATGKPDPAKVQAFQNKYPSAKRFQHWAATAPWSNSWANTQYNGIHTFVFKTDNAARYVRWSMHPLTPYVEMDAEQREKADADYLSDDLKSRLARGPLQWKMVITQAAPNDDVRDPTVAWENHEEHSAGILELTAAQSQDAGQCRDVNYDPTILPTGIALSDDPILAVRASVYAQSFNRRERETARGMQYKKPDVRGGQ